MSRSPATTSSKPRRRTRDPAPIGHVLVFFGLTFLLTAPIWWVSAATGFQILPGLPLAAVAVVCPAAAALLVASLRGGLSEGRGLLMRTLDFGRIKPAGWWLPILLISPGVAIVSFWILRLTGSSVPDAQIDLLTVGVLAAFFLVGALAEELGWSGFATDPLQARLGATLAGLVLGAVWAAWHYPALLQAHRSWVWIGWWTLGTVSMRVIIVWLFNRTHGSVFAAAVFHAVSNLSWQSFPIQGSWFDPRIHGLVMAAVASVVLLGSIRSRRAQLPSHRARWFS